MGMVSSKFSVQKLTGICGCGQILVRVFASLDVYIRICMHIRIYMYKRLYGRVKETQTNIKETYMHVYTHVKET